MKVEPINLKGKYVALEPLAAKHLDDFCEIGLDTSIWQWAPEPITTKDGWRRILILH